MSKLGGTLSLWHAEELPFSEAHEDSASDASDESGVEVIPIAQEQSKAPRVRLCAPLWIYVSIYIYIHLHNLIGTWLEPRAGSRLIRRVVVLSVPHVGVGRRLSPPLHLSALLACVCVCVCA